MDKYSKILFEEFKKPFKEGCPLDNLEKIIFSVTKHNPTCGDDCTVTVFENDKGHDGFFEGHMCSVTKASASIMMRLMEEGVLSRQNAKSFIDHYKKSKKIAEIFPESSMKHLLEALETFMQFPSRKKCVLLPWSAYEEGMSEVLEE